ncbi:MBL fold metallo-hydrolase [uncultured Roseobacter sp.]|uniref:MBL fold metallo-hydrolase n=1 Tax=uncultured Roseobacter sp. TaxID=114847 RepID=UPI002622E476|nr:MBL fold metallo-hydrolase [uncultured Roseobacter sp.]
MTKQPELFEVFWTEKEQVIMANRNIFLVVLLGMLVPAMTSESDEVQPSCMRLDYPSQRLEGLRVSWFGAASVVIDDGEHSVLIDPFVSREENTLFGIATGKIAKINYNAIYRRLRRPEISRAQVIFVGHSHYDHSLDVADFAKCLQVPVFRSADTSRIVKAHDYTEVKEFDPRLVLQNFRINGGFTVTALKSKHARPPACLASVCFDPLKKKVPDHFEFPAAIRDYGRGYVFTFYVEHKFGNVLHIGTAGIVPEFLKHIDGDVDVLMLALAGRNKRYLGEVLSIVKPRFVIPIHYDNLFKSIDEGVRVTRLAKLENFLKYMESEYPMIETRRISFDDPWILPNR